MSFPPFHRVLLDPAAQALPFTRSFLARLPAGFPVTVLDAGSSRPKGRGTVYLTTEPGDFLKACPCSPGVVRCGYWVLTLGFQCPFRCSYCFLRFYAPEEPLTLYANLEDARRAFLTALGRWEGPVRLGTGEFTDSLVLDPWTRHSDWLRELVAHHPKVLLELKTKSSRVEALLEGRVLPNVVVAWSVNPPGRVASDEAGSATLEERLEAASRVARAGYRVAFHFDPVILEGEWKQDYRTVIREIFWALDPRSIAWVSLGTLRFPARFLDRWGPALRGKSAFFAELLPGEDGKLRYFWPLRAEAYRFLAGELRRGGGEDLKVYLCMEPAGMWRTALGWEPGEAEVAGRLCA